MRPTPVACSLRMAASPLEGATPAARQSRFRGVSRTGFALLAEGIKSLAKEGCA
jgi:hypothetical protein